MHLRWAASFLFACSLILRFLCSGGSWPWLRRGEVFLSVPVGLGLHLRWAFRGCVVLFTMCPSCSLDVVVPGVASPPLGSLGSIVSSCSKFHLGNPDSMNWVMDWVYSVCLGCRPLISLCSIGPGYLRVNWDHPVQVSRETSKNPLLESPWAKPLIFP